MLPTTDDLPLPAYLSYIELLAQWNTSYNLTAIRDKEKMLAYHILDSLSVLPFIQDNIHQCGKCLDIGTGAGLPGIILALARPDIEWVLLDSNKKKIRFVRQAVLTLSIKNVETICCRVEHYEPPQQFSSIVSRAFSSLSMFFNSSYRLLVPGGSLWAMKGVVSENELAGLNKALAPWPTAISTQVISLKVPSVSGCRNLVQIKSQ